MIKEIHERIQGPSKKETIKFNKVFHTPNRTFVAESEAAFHEAVMQLDNHNTPLSKTHETTRPSLSAHLNELTKEMHKKCSKKLY